MHYYRLVPGEGENLAAALLESEKKEEFAKLLQEFTELGKRQSIAMAKLSTAQLKIDTYAASITQNLAELNALSHQRQSLEAVLDIRVRRYLKDMQERAIDALRWSIYALVMAYRYEYLMDVSRDFYNFDHVVKRLRRVDSAEGGDKGDPQHPKPDGAGDDTMVGAQSRLWKVDPDRFKKPEETALQKEFLDMALPILRIRQSVGSVRKNSWPCALSPGQRAELGLKGRVTFNLVRDLKNGSFLDTAARIVDIIDLTLDVKSNQPTLNLKAVFWHSGQSVVRSPAAPRRYYFFRAGQDDDPIFWGFNYGGRNADADGKAMAATVTKDEIPETNDEFLKKLLETPGASVSPSDREKLKYTEYFPSYFSDITLVLSHGNEAWDPSLKLIDEIEKVEFKVLYTFSSTAH